MDADLRDRTEAYITARYQHPAWQLLASRRAPLVLSCLQTLFEGSQNAIPFEDALQSLADLLTQHANQTDFDIGTEDRLSLARRELRDWIKRGLVIERDGSRGPRHRPKRPRLRAPTQRYHQLERRRRNTPVDSLPREVLLAQTPPVGEAHRENSAVESAQLDVLAFQHNTKQPARPHLM